MGLGTACGGERPDLPNVLLVSIDTLRADHMGLYGYVRDTTPRIDTFFADASIFENAMSTAPCTIPAVRQFLTGRFHYDEAAVPVAETLREHGYETAAFVSQRQFWRHREQYDRGFDTFDIQPKKQVDHHEIATRRAVEVSDRAIAWLSERSSARPLFLWLHYLDPHDPYEPPEVFRGFDRGNRSQRSGDRRSYRGEGYDRLSQEDVAHFVNLYDGEIQYTDAQIGRVLERMESLALLENSVAVLVSDHGELLGEGGRWDHCQGLDEEQIRVPFLLRVRGGGLGEYRRERLPVSTIDLVPTLLGLLGIPHPAEAYDGSNLLRASEDRVTIAFWRDQVAVRSGDWKLHVSDASSGLYQIAEDPAARRDRSAGAPEVRVALEAELRARGHLVAQAMRDDSETLRQLKQLGYIE